MNLSSIQKKKMASLFNYLRSNNGYYKKLLSSFAYIDDTNIDFIYEQLPVLYRSDIIDNAKRYYDPFFLDSINEVKIDISDLSRTDILSENHDRIIEIGKVKWYLETTSGTSGAPLPIIKNASERMQASAYINRCRLNLDPTCTISNGLLLVHKVDEHLKKIDIRGNNIEGLREVYQYMLLKKPKWIFSTAMIFKQFCTYIINNIDISERKKLSFVETTSQRFDDIDIANKIFDSSFINNYGCREVWNIAYECRHGALHVNTSNLVVDVVDDRNKLIREQGVEGNIVLTSLINKTTPFVKYLIGDRGKIIYTRCHCGNDSPILLLSEGRESEKIIGTNYYGNVVFRKVLRTLNFHHSIKDITHIKIFQVETNEMLVYLEKHDKNDKMFEKFFCDNFHLQIGFCKHFTIKFVYEYPFSQNVTKDSIFSNTGMKK